MKFNGTGFKALSELFSNKFQRINKQKAKKNE